MNAQGYDYEWLVDVREVRESCFVGSAIGIGRSWKTIAGAYSIGDVHIEPADPENALFSDLVVNVYGDNRSRTLIARSCEGDTIAGDLGELLLDNGFVVPAIGRILASQRESLLDWP